MSKVLIIPDIHLKTWIFDAYEANASKADVTVFLGDIVDDWGCGDVTHLYAGTLERYKEISKREDVLLCYGNHDVSYIIGRTETGYSAKMRNLVKTSFDEIKEVAGNRLQIVHKVDNLVFSHAGITDTFANRTMPDGIEFDTKIENIDDIIRYTNAIDLNKLWTDDTPIWARPQLGWDKLIMGDFLQVVGHTPIEKIELDNENNLLSLDNLSTHSGGEPIAHPEVVVLNSVTMEIAETIDIGEFYRRE